MMFMIPMPPTSRLTAAIPARSSVNVSVVALSVARKSTWLRMLKSSGRPGRILCERRIAAWISAIAALSESSETASAQMSLTRSVPKTSNRPV